MTYINLCENIIKQNLENVDKIQIEFQEKDITLVHTLFDEMYNKLYNYYNYDDAEIIGTIADIDKDIEPYYDYKLCYFKVRIKNILINNYNIETVHDALYDYYKNISYKMLEMMQVKEN